MVKPRSAETTAAPGSQGAALAHEWLLYVLGAGIVLAIMLLAPDLLNNMILTAVVLLLVVSIIPAMLRKRR